MDKIDYYKQAARNKKNKKYKLTDKQIKFCNFYIESNNATESYVKAYGLDNRKSAEVLGCNLLRNIKIKLYIDSIMKQKNKEKIAYQNEILELLTKHARGQTEEEVVNVVGIGDHCSDTKKDKKKIVPKDQIRALELLSKRYYDDKLLALEKEKFKFDKHNKNAKFEQDKQVHADKMTMEEKRLKNDDIDMHEDDGFIEALQGEVKNIWADESIKENETKE